jgi:hypothetical protein
MKLRPHFSDSANTLVVALLALVILSGFIQLAVDYTNNIARFGQRDRAFNTAVEIGDGCISQQFAAWRQICKTAGIQNPPTNAFTIVPAPILGLTGQFPSYPNVTIANYKVQAVDPLITLSSLPSDPPVSALPTLSPPPMASGPGSGTYSYFYLASVDITLPSISGPTSIAKVRRVFEKRFTSPWNWAMMYNGDLELHPDQNLTLNGWVHSNGNVYVGNGTSDPMITPTSTMTFSDRLSYQGDYTVGFAPNDPDHSSWLNLASPNTPSDLPPGHEQFYSLFGWDQTKFNTTDSNPDNDSYHEMIDKPSVPWTSGASTDPFKDQRLYNQAYNIADANGNYGIVVNVDASNNISVGYAGVTYNNQPTGNGSARLVNWNAVIASVHPNYTIQDNREQATVRVINFDIGQFKAANPKSWNGIIYINDTSASSANHRAVRIVNGAVLPSGGMTIVTPNPLYIQGDFNSGRTALLEPPSNLGLPDSPEVAGYTHKPASVMADAITLLSNGWTDANSTAGLSSRIATNTTVNAALVGGNVPSDGSHYSGGGENFVRFMEDWTGKSFTYWGSMLCPYPSAQGAGYWGSANVYNSPQQSWFFDKSLSTDSSGNPVTVPGYISTVAYLQQQRWYLQY